jgi:hypothetical protein
MPKKTVKKSTAKVVAPKNVKPAAAKAPVVHECHCGCSCTPLKKTIILTCMFLLGFAVAKFAFCSCRACGHKIAKEHPVFVNGCLDMQSIKCPKMQEILANADMDADGCISVSEFNTVKRIMHRGPRKPVEE